MGAGHLASVQASPIPEDHDVPVTRRQCDCGYALDGLTVVGGRVLCPECSRTYVLVSIDAASGLAVGGAAWKSVTVMIGALVLTAVCTMIVVSVTR